MTLTTTGPASPATATPSATPTNPDFEAIKAKQHAVWSSGDYGRIGVTLQITGEQLCEAMDLRGGSRVLDVAAGNGNATLAAARRFCDVTATDYVEELLGQAEARARAESLDVDFRRADAEALPFEDASYDAVVSTFGVMFAPDQAKAASELVRVCKPGGTIGLANWTPDGFIGQLLRLVGRYVAPPAGVASPSAWGTQAFLKEHFGTSTSRIETTDRWFVFRYASPEQWVDVFATYYGPTLKAFSTLDDQRAQELRDEILELIRAFNRADDGTMVVPSSYVEVVVTK